MLTLERFCNVLLALLSLLNTFEVFCSLFECGRTLLIIQVTKDALNSIKIKPALTEAGSHEDHYRVTLLELSTPMGLTMEKYRTELDQNPTQIRGRLNSHYQLLLRNWTPQDVSKVEEVSEAEIEGSSVNGHSLSCGDSEKDSLSRRIIRRIMPSSVGRKMYKVSQFASCIAQYD